MGREFKKLLEEADVRLSEAEMKCQFSDTYEIREALQTTHEVLVKIIQALRAQGGES